ncbi:hypothetical protein [Marinicrinis lubricantis]|uniref:Uncharacterized protein n=1 Tax=Marinicrinis lubricantis TaxID=2086470 RepID=A0ABW1IL27_9BACL
MTYLTWLIGDAMFVISIVSFLFLKRKMSEHPGNYKMSALLLKVFIVISFIVMTAGIFIILKNVS